ncbi:MAG TPA: hypothetical protein PLW34_08145 [Termitinemataceae bacterium]|uniref:hypothetical protein n=1 Tax=Treponema sp. J25 TaxID=2094121 RepID=UPI00104DDD7B|nr:hypothetical protein [Treponema sp. J25]TCW60047.1 hypothetical protein C5O22_13565 [Treponema sp. J25]HOJ99515.1 hypothetical protein [Termitinemataceae bacterium]HOM23783.1 hypothetical protein [Termitinemataceae bacterium]HPQ00823.1 hypothetical protein [Termitinemataceae bacterium]
MLLIGDESYKLAKEIKKGNVKVVTEFIPFIDWVNKKYSVKVLNVSIEYEKIKNKIIPRISIILERRSDFNKFVDDRLTIDINKQNECLEAFLKLYPKKIKNVEEAFVTFDNFENTAIYEAISAVKKDELEEIKKSVDKDCLWLIDNTMGFFVVLTNTEREREEINTSDACKIIKEKLFNLVKLYDEFNYITPDNLKIEFDSKENFEKNYKDNWFYYYR